MDVKKQLDIIKRNTEEIIPEDELLSKLKKSQNTKIPLRIKWGAEPG